MFSLSNNLRVAYVFAIKQFKGSAELGYLNTDLASVKVYMGDAGLLVSQTIIENESIMHDVYNSLFISWRYASEPVRFHEQRIMEVNGTAHIWQPSPPSRL